MTFTWQDLPELAGSLVKKVQAIPLWEEEWKLVTIMVGQADLCAHSCNATLKEEVTSGVFVLQCCKSEFDWIRNFFPDPDSKLFVSNPGPVEKKTENR